MPTFEEELKYQAALMEIRLERKRALAQMFSGTQLKVKSWKDDAKKLKDEAKKAKKAIDKIRGIDLPDIEVGIPGPNFGLFFRKIRFDIDLPDFDFSGILWDVNIIPDTRIGDIPGFSLPGISIPNIKLGRLPDLPDVNLRVLIAQIALEFPDLDLPAIVWDVGRILKIPDLPDFCGIKGLFPEFFSFEWEVTLPNINVPDVNIPRLRMPEMPTIDLKAIEIPGIDLSRFWNVPGFDKVLRLLVELFDVADLPEIIIDLGGVEILTDFISSALPIVQQVKSGSKAAYHAGKAAQDFHKSMKVNKHMVGVLPGDARSAAEAVRKLLRESSGEYATLATIEGTQFAVSTAGLFADLGAGTGPAVSAGASLAKLCQKIAIFGFKYKEYKKINALLSSSPEDTLGDHLFTVCPLLGCYYLANNTTSSVLNVLSSDIMHDVDWMSNAEQNKRKHLDPLIKEAQRFIDKSRYVLFPIRQDKGMYKEKSTMEKLKARFTLALKKKVGLAPRNQQVQTHTHIGTR